MSYFIAQSIQIEKNGQIWCVGDDNNVYPKHNRKYQFHGGLKELFEDIKGGNIQPVDSANEYKWRYIMSQVYDEQDEQKQLDLFIKLLHAKNAGKYKLVRLSPYGKEYFVKPKGKFGFRYRVNDDNVPDFKFFKASHFAKRYGFDMIPVK